MPFFSGFPEGKVRMTPVPVQFFSELLPEIDHLVELKLCLYAIWKLDRMEEEIRYLCWEDFAEDERFMQGLGELSIQRDAALEDALERAVGRGTLLCVGVKQDDEKPEEKYYFLNSPRGRAAVEALQNGQWKLPHGRAGSAQLADERPNIFRLYEENIGPLTPLMADVLREAEKAYPVSWLEEAISIAVQRNARNWRFVEAVLKRWKEEGRDEQDRRNAKKDRRRYDEGEFADFIER